MKYSRLVNSFQNALRGLSRVFRTEQNFRIQVAGSVMAVIAAWMFPLRAFERIIIVLFITLVLVAELLNTALEYFTDLLKPRLHQYARAIKDIMAGIVFITSLAALAVGAMIFVPYFIEWLK